MSCTPRCWLLVPPRLDSIDTIHGSQALQVIQQRVQLHLQTSNREHEGMGLSYDRVPSSSAAATALPAPDLVVLRILRGRRSLLAMTPCLLSPALLAPLFRRHSGSDAAATAIGRRPDSFKFYKGAEAAGCVRTCSFNCSTLGRDTLDIRCLTAARGGDTGRMQLRNVQLAGPGATPRLSQFSSFHHLCGEASTGIFKPVAARS